MSTVGDLRSGDLVYLPGADISGVFIAQAGHPDHRGLQLVIWKLSDGTISFDALHFMQEIGQIQPASPRERGIRLDHALRTWSAEAIIK